MTDWVTNLYFSLQGHIYTKCMKQSNIFIFSRICSYRFVWGSGGLSHRRVLYSCVWILYTIKRKQKIQHENLNNQLVSWKFLCEIYPQRKQNAALFPAPAGMTCSKPFLWKIVQPICLNPSHTSVYAQFPIFQCHTENWQMCGSSLPPV